MAVSQSMKTVVLMADEALTLYGLLLCVMLYGTQLHTITCLACQATMEARTTDGTKRQLAHPICTIVMHLPFSSNGFFRSREWPEEGKLLLWGEREGSIRFDSVGGSWVGPVWRGLPSPARARHDHGAIRLTQLLPSRSQPNIINGQDIITTIDRRDYSLNS